MGRHRTQDEKDRDSVLTEALKALRKRHPKAAETIPSWWGKDLILDVKDDGCWLRYAWSA